MVEHKATKAVEVVAALAVASVGWFTCAPIPAMVGALSSIGVNWAGELLMGAYRDSTRSWLTEKGVLNGDLRRALARAFVSTFEHIEDDYVSSQAYKRLGVDVRNRDEATIVRQRRERNRRQLRVLVTGAERLFADEQALRIIAEGKARIFMEQAANEQERGLPSVSSMRSVMLGSLTDWLSDEEPDLRQFVFEYVSEERLSAMVEFFFDEIKSGDGQGTAAWRAWQMQYQQSFAVALMSLPKIDLRTAQIQQGVFGIELRAADIDQRTAGMQASVDWLVNWAKTVSGSSLSDTEQAWLMELPTTLRDLSTQIETLSEQLLAGQQTISPEMQKLLLKKLQPLLLSDLPGSPRRPTTSLSWDQLHDVASYIYESRGVSRVTDQRDMGLYQDRNGLDTRFEDFLRSDKTGFILIGKSGVGKSSFLKHLYQAYSQMLSPEVCILLYSARELKSDVPLDELIAADVAQALQVSLSDVWNELDRIVGSEELDQQRQIILCVDALDEHPGSPAALLRQVDGLIRHSLRPWLKVIITSRSESWHVIVRGLSDFDFANRYYLPPDREWTPDTDWLMFSHELHAFEAGELPLVYMRYRDVHPGLPLFEELRESAPETAEAIRDPLLLRLVAEISNTESISSLSIRQIIPKYVGYLVGSARKLTADDVRYMHDVLVPQMISIERSVFNNGIRLEEQALTPSIIALANANILETRRVLENPGSVQVRFRFERFWDYYSGEWLFEELSSSSSPEDQCIAMVQMLKDKPFLGGALVSALWSAVAPAAIGEQPWEGLLMQLAGSADPDCRGVAGAAIEEYYRTAPSDQRQAAAQILQRMFPSDAQRRCSQYEERQALIAVRIAGNLNQTDILERSMLAQSALIRDRAVVSAYDLWLGDRNAGFNFLQSLSDPLRHHGLVHALVLNRRRLESCLRYSVLIWLRHFRENGVLGIIQQIWQPIIQRYLLHSPQSQSFERVVAPVRTALLWLITRLVGSIEQEVPARQSVLNFQELRLFFKLPIEIRSKSKELLPFLNPLHRDMSHLSDTLWALFEQDGINSMLLKLLIDYALVAQGLHRFVNRSEDADGRASGGKQEAELEEVLALARKLAYAEIARQEPTNRHRIQWDKTWVYAALAHLSTDVGTAFFEEYTELVKSAVLAGEWWGPIRDHSFNGYAEYAQTAMRLRPDQADILLRYLLTWAVDESHEDPQLVLDILEEIGYLANTRNQALVLKIIEPALVCWPSLATGPDLEKLELIRAVHEKLIMVMAAVRSRNPHGVQALFERAMVRAKPNEIKHLEYLRSQVLVKNTDERIVGDLLKGGLGPWGQFIVEHAFSAGGNQVLVWAFEMAFSVRDWNQLIFALAKNAANVVSGATIFRIPEVPLQGQKDYEATSSHI